MSNVLTGVIQITAPGVKKTFDDLSLSLSNQRSILKNLQVEYAKLSTTQLSSPFGKELAADIKIAQAEIKRLEAGSVSSFGNIGAAATKGFSAVRNLAYLLPGIGIAGIFSIAGDAVISFTKSLFGMDEEVTKSSIKLEDFVKDVNDLKQAFAGGEAGQVELVQSLAAAVTDQTKSYKERNNALNELKSINKGYFGDLSLEEASLVTLTKRVEEYTNALIAAAVTKGFQDEISKTSVELSKQISVYNKLGKELDNANRALEKTTKLRGTAYGTESISYQYIEAEKAVKKANDALKAQGKIIDPLTSQMGELKKALNDAVAEEIKFTPLKGGSATVPVKVKVEKPESFDLVSILDGFSGEDAAREMYKKIAKAFRDPTLFRGITGGLTDEGLITNNVKIKFKISDDVQAALDRKAAAAKAGADLGKSFSDALNTALVDGLSAIGEGIGNILSGQKFGNQFAQVIGTLLQTMGKALIKFGVVKLGIDKIIKDFKIPGAFAIGLGVFAIAAGQLIKNISGARALGGPVAAGGTYLVGEKGPELFTPNTGGQITPNNMLGGRGVSGGGVMVQVAGEFIQRGQDLLAVITLANQSKARLI